MAKVTAQQVHALITFYVNEYEKRFGQKPEINRYRERFGFQAMLEDLGSDAKPTIEYYLDTKRVTHPLVDLLRNYDRIDKIRREFAEDEVKRAELRRETKKRVEEFENRYGTD